LLLRHRSRRPARRARTTPLRWLVTLIAIGLALTVALPGTPQATLPNEPGGSTVTGPSGSRELQLSPVAALALTHTYGPGIGMDSLNNSYVGGSGNNQVSYRFRASTSARLSSIRVYVMGPSHSGYGAGTGGTWRVTVRPDDGTARHRPSGRVLASTSIRPTKVFPVIQWSSKAKLTRGRLYHIVFTNVDAHPTSNYASLNGVFTYDRTAHRQPAFSNHSWGQLSRSSGGGWSESSSTVPIMQLNYANGVVRGVGYMEVWIGAAKTISGSARARETFTVRGANRRISRVGVRLRRSGGSSPLTIRLERSGGSLVASCSVKASTITTSGHASWARCAFSSAHTLRSGRTYHLVVSTSSGTSYSLYVIRQGTSYGFSSQTYFRDGRAQYTAGNGWGGFDQPGGSGNAGEADLQFYLK
jgi:Beta-propeller repeat